jgi:hypothetical protein
MIPQAFGYSAPQQSDGNLVVDSALLLVAAFAQDSGTCEGCVIYALPRPMKSPFCSSVCLSEGRFPQTRNSFVIVPTRLFRWRFPCTE